MTQRLYRMSAVFVDDAHVTACASEQQRIPVLNEAGRKEDTFTCGNRVCPGEGGLAVANIVASKLIAQVVSDK